jgi:hypothetical protein
VVYDTLSPVFLLIQMTDIHTTWFRHRIHPGTLLDLPRLGRFDCHLNVLHLAIGFRAQMAIHGMAHSDCNHFTAQFLPSHNATQSPGEELPFALWSDTG